MNTLQHVEAPIILAINKVDLVKDKSKLLPFIETISQKMKPHSIIPLSSLKDDNVANLEMLLDEHIPESPFYFAGDEVTNRSKPFQMSEIVREKIMRHFEQEVPYSTHTQIEHIEEDERMYIIHAVIWVERTGQKAIIIGKKGETLKAIGTKARLDLEKLLNKKVLLKCWVKVKDNWADNLACLQEVGLTDI